jgi:heme oxygenase (mycobilin-producing)
MTPQPTYPQIDNDTDPVTLINVFEIDSDKLELFFAEWRKRAEFMSKQPGFRSLKLHRALTPDARFQLVNVAEWDSADALHTATAQQYFQESTRRSVDDVGVTAHPAIYRVALEVTAPELSEQQTLND